MPEPSLFDLVQDDSPAGSTGDGQEDNTPTDDNESDTGEDKAVADGNDDSKGGDDNPVGDFVQSFNELTGMELDGDYDDVESAKQAIADKFGNSDSSSDDATNWQNLMDAAREDPKVLDLLQNAIKGESPDDTPPPKKAPATSGGNGEVTMPRSMDELQLWRSQLYDDEGRLRKDADQGVVDRMTAFNDKMQEVLFNLVSDPDKVLSPSIDKMKKELQDTSRSELQQQESNRKMQQEYESITNEYSDKLFIDGDRTKLTAYGKGVREAYGSLLDDGMPESPKAYRRALRDAADAVTPPQKILKPSSRAGRKPATQPATHDTFDEEEFFQKGGDLVKLLALKTANRDAG